MHKYNVIVLLCASLCGSVVAFQFQDATSKTSLNSGEPKLDVCKHQVNEANKTSCGWPGIGQDSCKILGCCWDNKHKDTKMKCFPLSSPNQTRRLHKRETTNEDDDNADVDKLIAKARNVIAAMKALKQKILDARRDYNIAKTVGASVSTAGIFCIIGGIVAAPFTAGLSLGLTIGGVAGTVAGGATTITTVIVENSKTQQWAEELITPMTELEVVWNATMSELVHQPGWVKVNFISFPDLFSAAELFSIFDPWAEVFSVSSAVSSSTASFMSATSGGAGSTAASFVTATSGSSFMSVGSTAGATASTATTTASAALSVGGVVFGVVGIGLNVYTIVDTWANDPQLATQIDTLVITWTNIISDLEDFCRQNPETCENLKEKKCERMMTALEIARFGERQRKRETHANMFIRTCADIGAEWNMRYTQPNSGTLANGDNSPINYVGYKWVLNPQVPERIFEVVTHVHGTVTRQHVGRGRQDFGDEWNRRMDLLGHWPGDEKGHIVGDQIGGVITWYNLVPMTARLNRNVGNGGGQGMLNMDNAMRWFVENRCGTVEFNHYLNYENEEATRPKGLKACLRFRGAQRNFWGTYYFRNDIP